MWLDGNPMQFGSFPNPLGWERASAWHYKKSWDHIIPFRSWLVCKGKKNVWKEPIVQNIVANNFSIWYVTLFSRK